MSHRRNPQTALTKYLIDATDDHFSKRDGYDSDSLTKR
jgi:hypothetical protein